MNSILFYVISIFVFVVLVYITVKRIRSTPRYEDSYYYKFTDDQGHKSIIHDSGIKPSITPPSSPITLHILKREISAGIPVEIFQPISIFLGMGIDKFTKVKILNIVEDDLQYNVTIETPSSNIFYGKNITRENLEEIINETSDSSMHSDTHVD